MQVAHLKFPYSVSNRTKLKAMKIPMIHVEELTSTGDKTPLILSPGMKSFGLFFPS